eukprot:Plantae.Rhodophyta-Purpureofilum_apyrenoidigerum.ctg2994.p1 GENE.Plantae.Rhodophyta-Purpureofilum_apyrenoidigerum.ctg2994~~Plantae.Rhodophyta-Purpureofilum_apyrenoidigerum.ctg2994.p1  ORF type:complete len:956 (+),score=186.46 Plantae.Rhodophyta-Purpureofilum_apyrenoidigerum.ctg2994:40-2907(+)
MSRRCGFLVPASVVVRSTSRQYSSRQRPLFRRTGWSVQGRNRAVLRKLTVAMTATNTATAEMVTQRPTAKYLKDYQPPKYLVQTIDMEFELDDPETKVTSRIKFKRNSASKEDRMLYLNGDKGVKLVEGSLKIDGNTLEPDAFKVTSEALIIDETAIPKEGTFTLESAVMIKPSDNKALEGLYKSGGNFCTQCEAEGFRRITYYPDRPDVMAVYTITIVADKKQYPVLLSNGNNVDEGDLENGKHYAKYHDPFPKPSYLFALVAGDLVCNSDSFRTMSGKDVTLKIFVRDGDEQKTQHAMDSLKRSMKWDEQVYGREYDLDIFNVVAVDDFNMGAMENKSLNIFNSRFVLVSPETATDTDYNSVEGIIAHEYFHNWTGNRVTCRDWFQLSLKEGLTVFRDQNFSADMSSKGVKRISEVIRLRAAQFPEDSGPMAHPIRPEQFIEINNFYTQTVYQKGAEVIRMLHTILGAEGFRKGTDLYFERHDGQAVTCEDWISALQDANPQENLTIFKRWYSQAGTPTVTCRRSYNSDKQELELQFSQTTPKTPGQDEKLALQIPISVGLLSNNGDALRVDTGDGSPSDTKVLSLTDYEQTFTLKNVPEGSIVSLLRDFSAPVKLSIDGGQDLEELAFLVAHDKNDFTRWEAAQQLALRTVLSYYDAIVKDGVKAQDLGEVSSTVVEAYSKVLKDKTTDKALLAALLITPGESYLAEQLQEANPVAIHSARNHFRSELAKKLRNELLEVIEETREKGEYALTGEAKGRRSLNGAVSALYSCLKEEEFYRSCLDEVRNATNMTSVLSALGILASSTSKERDIALAEFYDKWKNNNLVVLKWLGIQAGAPREDALDVVKNLMNHEAFDITVPNKVYSVIGGLCGGNPYGFHVRGQESYDFLAEQVLKLDALNPQVASRMAKMLSRYRQFDATRQNQIRRALHKIAKHDGLSSDVYEVVTKSLAA